MDKYAFLFAGQGSQYVGMGQYLYENFDVAKDVFTKASDILGYNVYELCISDPNTLLNQTAYTQVAIYTTTIAALKVIESLGIKPSACLGLSLGEYVALVCANVITFEEGLVIVKERGKIMQEAVPPGIGAMAAVIGCERSIIEEVCSSITSGIVEVANYNCSSQIVIGGEVNAVKEAIEKLTPLSKKVVELNVSGPFHTKLMKDAADTFKKVLEKFDYNKPTIGLITNVTGDYITSDFIDNLTKQMASSVYFEDSIKRLISLGYENFIEIGPGNTLSNFVKFIQKDCNVRCNIMNFENENSVVKTLEKIGVEVHA